MEAPKARSPPHATKTAADCTPTSAGYTSPRRRWSDDFEWLATSPARPAYADSATPTVWATALVVHLQADTRAEHPRRLSGMAGKKHAAVRTTVIISAAALATLAAAPLAPSCD